MILQAVIILNPQQNKLIITNHMLDTTVTIHT